MAVTLATGYPKQQNERSIYKYTVTATNDAITFRPGRSFNFADYPVMMHIQRGTGTTLEAQYSLDPDLASNSFITMEPGDIIKDHAVIFDFYATGFRLRVKTGSANASTVWVESAIPLATA